jgi:hypothetical protein
MPSPAPTRGAGLSQEEAQAVVREWFEALRRGDYRGAENLTSGNAILITRGLEAAVQGESAARGAQVEMVMRQLLLDPGAPPPSGQAVDVTFDIQVNALLGPLSLAAQQVRGNATFLVDRVDGSARIVDVTNATGLP